MIAKRVLIAEDHPICASALSMVIRTLNNSIHVVQVDTLSDLRLALDDGPVDLVTLDLELRDSFGFQTLLAVRAMDPSLAVLVISADCGARLEGRLKSLGARGYISKAAALAEIQAAIGTLLDGGTWFSAQTNAADPDDAVQAIGNLSPAQTRVFTEMSAGHSNKEIAHRLGLAEQTVKTHVSAILRCLGVPNRSQAIVMIRKSGII